MPPRFVSTSPRLKLIQGRAREPDAVKAGDLTDDHGRDHDRDPGHAARREETEVEAEADRERAGFRP